MWILTAFSECPQSVLIVRFCRVGGPIDPLKKKSLFAIFFCKVLLFRAQKAYRCWIQCKDFIANIDIGSWIYSIQGSDQVYKILPEVGIYSQVSALICTWKCGLINVASDSKVIKFVFMCFQASADITQWIKRGQLTKKQLNKLVPAIEFSCAEIAIVLWYTFFKLITVNKMQKLSKNVLSWIHSLV